MAELSMDTPTKLIIGLGNPGRDYERTRHNIGFEIIDTFARIHGITVGKRDYRALAGDGRVGDTRVFLLKPQTFMNRSGEPLQSFLAFKKVPIESVIVVHDEIDLPLGAIRVKIGGGEGGHNGLRSISAVCGGRNYARVRVGVGKPPPGSPLALQPDGVATWVLGRFLSDEMTAIQEVVGRAVGAVTCLATAGLERAQRDFNR